MCVSDYEKTIKNRPNSNAFFIIRKNDKNIATTVKTFKLLLLFIDHSVWSWSLVFWSVKPFQLFHSISGSSPRILILRRVIDSLSNEDSENQYLICGDEIVMKLERFQGQFGSHSKLPLTNAVVSALSLDSCRTVGSSIHCYLLSLLDCFE